MDSGPALRASRNDEERSFVATHGSDLFKRGYALAFSRHALPEFCNQLRPKNVRGAGNAGCPMAPVVGAKKAPVVATGSPGSTGIPCAMVLRFPSSSSR